MEESDITETLLAMVAGARVEAVRKADAARREGELVRMHFYAAHEVRLRALYEAMLEMVASCRNWNAAGRDEHGWENE